MYGINSLEIKQFQEARLTLLSAIRLLERRSEDSKELMISSFLLGRVNEEEWSYDKALAWYDRSLGMLERMEKKDKEMKARIVSRIGLVKFAQKSFDDALRFVKEAQDIFVSQNGAHSLDYADCVHSCGRIHFEMKEFPTSRDCFQSALQVRQQYLKADDPELGDSFHCLGAVLAELEQFQEASSCLSEALRIRLVNFGENGDVVGESQRCFRYCGIASRELEKSPQTIF
jgi:tetratricopeptide (TPR) repeat protein